MEKEAWRIEKEQMVEGFRVKNRTALKGQIVCVGSSLMEMFPIEEWVKEWGPDAPVIYNRGVGGYKTTDILPILDACVLDLKPRRVFINIGTNDLSDASIPMEELMGNYDRILAVIQEELPGVEIYLMAYYPVNYEAAAEEMKSCLLVRNNDKINRANEEVKKLAEKHHQRFININKNLMDEKGNLKAEYTIEGMHIRPEGYRAILKDFMGYALEPAWK